MGGGYGACVRPRIVHIAASRPDVARIVESARRRRRIARCPGGGAHLQQLARRRRLPSGGRRPCATRAGSCALARPLHAGRSCVASVAGVARVARSGATPRDPHSARILLLLICHVRLHLPAVGVGVVVVVVALVVAVLLPLVLLAAVALLLLLLLLLLRVAGAARGGSRPLVPPPRGPTPHRRPALLVLDVWHDPAMGRVVLVLRPALALASPLAAHALGVGEPMFLVLLQHLLLRRGLERLNVGIQRLDQRGHPVVWPEPATRADGLAARGALLLKQALATLDAIPAEAVQALGRHGLAHQLQAHWTAQLGVERADVNVAHLVAGKARVDGLEARDVRGQTERGRRLQRPLSPRHREGHQDPLPALLGALCCRPWCPTRCGYHDFASLRCGFCRGRAPGCTPWSFLQNHQNCKTHFGLSFHPGTTPTAVYIYNCTQRKHPGFLPPSLRTYTRADPSLGRTRLRFGLSNRI